MCAVEEFISPEMWREHPSGSLSFSSSSEEEEENENRSSLINSTLASLDSLEEALPAK